MPPCAYFSCGGLIMMCAVGLPGNINHGPPGIGIVESPIQGPAGNREFLIYARRGPGGPSGEAAP